MKDFNINKYMEYQNELLQKLKDKKITSSEYSTLSTYDNEFTEFEQEVINLQQKLVERNLPFTIEIYPNNIQVLIYTNKKIIEDMMKTI